EETEATESEKFVLDWFIVFIASVALSIPLFYKFQCGVQRVHELFDLNGFGEIAEKPHLQAHRDVAWHGIGAEGNDGDVRRGRVFAEDFQGFDAADAG